VQPRLALLLGTVIVAATVLLAATFAFSLGRPQSGPPHGSVLINFEGPDYFGSLATLTAIYASPAVSPSSFLLYLVANGSGATPAGMPMVSGIRNAELLVSPAGGYYVYWTDSDGNSLLSTGDTLTIYPGQPPVVCCQTLSLYLLWAADESTITEATFGPYPVLSPPPSITLGAAVRGAPNNVWISVASASAPYLSSYFLASMTVAGNASVRVPVQPYGLASNLTVAGGEYVVAWYDLNDDLVLNSGDAFNVTLASGSWPASGTEMGFELWWYNDTELAAVWWTA
jgi:hypothetical protein